MLYLVGGFAILGGFLLLVYLFVNADPARLARGLKVTGIVIADCCGGDAGDLRAARGAVGAGRDDDAVAGSRPQPLLDRYRTPCRRSDLDCGDAVPAHDARSRHRQHDRHHSARPFQRHAGRGARRRRPPGAIARMPGRGRGGRAPSRSLSRSRSSRLARRARRRASRRLRRRRRVRPAAT